MRHFALVVVVALVACGGKNSTSPEDAAIDAKVNLCGNGVVDPGEDCDDGVNNGGPGHSCSTTCHWACLNANYCTDMEPCNGEETCADHVCLAGTYLPDGATCGTGKICLNATCTVGVCGDGFTTAHEECDDANQVPGDGCENGCKYSCLSTDTTRNCTPTDVCAGQGTCNDGTHTCTPGTKLPDNTTCPTGFCKNGMCTMATCGNGTMEPGEQCDDGALNGTAGDGCKTNCMYACVNPATDCGAAPACEKETCSMTHVCQAVADATKNGMSCGAGGLVCNNGSCAVASAVCGNGIVEMGEQCDFGMANGPGAGCELNCKFSCTIIPNSCDDANACNGAETCMMNMVGTGAGQKCFAGTPLANGTTCGTGKICLAQACATSTCGDGFVDAAKGETCEPPNMGTCDAMCHTIACGDGVRAGTEQCDDGNLKNLDGCSSTCKFEQDQRVNALSLPFNTDAYCTKNALGGAITGSIAQNSVTNSLTTGVGDGSITVMLAAQGLDDLTGTNDPQLTLGPLGGVHATGATTYNGASDLDWWYTTSATSIDANRNPVTLVPASIAAKVLNAGPAEITLSISIAGAAAMLDMFNSKLRANIGATSSPLASAGGTPGHLAAEHLDATLVSFGSMSAGELCGNTTAASLATVPAPMALVGCGFTNCNECFTANNSLLDILVSGCGTLVGTQIKVTQPDTARVATDVYTFSVNGAHQVTACKKNGAAGVLSDCLANAAYTSFFKFTTDRVIAK